MTQQARRNPPAPGWIKEHLRRYLESDGEDGYIWNNCPILLLTTTGKRSGKPYTTPLIFGRHGDAYVIVASYGGAPRHPQWYRNLLAQPLVDLQVRGDRFRARARQATDEEKPALWKRMADIYPPYEQYQARAPRDIPVVIIEPA